MAKALGIKELTIITPSGTQVIVIDTTINRPPKISTPLGLLYEFLGSGEFQ